MSTERFKHIASMNGISVAAFLLERDRDIFDTEVLSDNPCQTVRRIVAEAKRRAVNMEMEGTGPEAGALYPYDAALAKLGELSMAIANARAELLRLKNHTHQFDDTDYCVHCGLDGRA